MYYEQAKAAPAPVRPPTEINVKIHSLYTTGSLLATASVDLNGIFAIRGVRVMEGKNGPFVSMPSRQVNGKYQDICFPCTKEFRQEFQNAVLDAYQMALEHRQDQAPTRGGMSMSM